MKKVKCVFIKDKYLSDRGGLSKFLNIYCDHCGNFLLLYQKDGPGVLKRLYLDRILAPDNLSILQKQNIKIINNLKCPNCDRVIAIPGLYEKENRKSYFLLSYVIKYRLSDGEYPVKKSTI